MPTTLLWIRKRYTVRRDLPARQSDISNGRLPSTRIVGFTQPVGKVSSNAVSGQISTIADLYGQSLPNPLRWRDESLKTTHDHFAQ